MHILIAPNAFKNSLSATEVANTIQQGLQQSELHGSTECFPIGDGGDGTAALIVEKGNGVYIDTEVNDPVGRKITTAFGLMDNGRTAVIEMADASGLKLLEPEMLNPLHASSSGTGTLIRAALDRQVSRIILGIGGSATVDGGSGILQTLGIRFLDAAGNSLPGLPENLVNLYRVDMSGLDPRMGSVELVVLCDVENTLLGENGASAVFGPQKGASNEDVQQLEKALTRLRDILLDQTGKDISLIKHGGAAGGTASGLSILPGAKLVNGIDYFLDITGFDEALQQADLVITAEGSIDEQTLQGKGPYGVAKRAKEKKIPVIGLAGKVPLHASIPLGRYFDALIPIGHQPLDTATAIKYTAADLLRTAYQLGNILAMKKA